MENNKMPYRQINNKLSVIFSDVDGTLYEDLNDVMPQTVNDIKFAKENNAQFNLCTGNPFFDRMEKLCKKINANYIIASSGSHIYDLNQKMTIYKAEIKNDLLIKIIDSLKEIDCQIVFWNEKEYFLLKKESGWNKEILEYHFISELLRSKIPKIYNNEKIDVLKIEIYANNYKNVKQKLAEIYKKIKNIDGIEIIITSLNIEIQSKNITKASAIEWMLENVYKNLDITESDIMTIGDSNNDLTMLKLAKYSYAMANSSKLAIEAANYYTSSVEQNGLGEAIIDYLYRVKNVVKEYLFHKTGGKNGK